MPFMPQVQLPDFDPVNALFSNDRNAILHNQALTGTQDLADRATLRGLAPDLATANPLGMATASTLGPQGTAAVNSVDATIKARQQQAMYSSGLGTQVASSVAAMPDETSAAAAYPVLRQRAIASGMDPAMLPEQFTGRAGMLAIRNTAVPVGTAVELYAKRPYTDGQDPGPLGIPGVGGVAAPGGSPSAQQGAAAGGDDGLINALGRVESPAGPGVVNAQGYSGQFQFGKGRLADLGIYQPAPGENLKDNHQWAGAFNIPGNPQVRTYGDFLNDADAQRAAMHVHVADIHNVIAQTPGADRFSPDGLIAVAHLGGVGGMQKFVATNGAYNPGDNPRAPGGGTHLSDYYIRYSNLGRAQLGADHGHPQGPLPTDHPAMPQILASANGSAGMPQTATDAQPATVAAPWGDVNSLLDNYRQQGAAAPAPADTRVAADPSYTANRNAPVPGQGITAQQAVQQATAELSDKLGGLGAEAANAAVQQRALELLGRGSAPAAPAGALQPSTPTLAPPVPQAIPPRPVFPGSSVMTARPHEDLLFPPAGDAARLPMAAAPGMQKPPRQNALLAGLPGAGTAMPSMPVNSLASLALPPVAGGASSFVSNPLVSPPAPSSAAERTPEAAQAGPMPAQRTGQVQAPPGAQLRMVEGKPIAVEGQPGMYQGTLNGRIISMPLPGTFNTGRLVSRPNPNGGADLYAPSGQLVVPATANARDVQKADYERDAKSAEDFSDAAQSAQTIMIRLQQMRDLVDKLNTGAGGESRAQLAAWAQTYLPERAAKWASDTAGMSDPAAAEELSKLALRGAGDQERGVLGARGGYQATKLFQAMNPGLNLLPGANKAILNSQLVSAQADTDYAQGAMAHFNTNAAPFRTGIGGYTTPLSEFNRTWTAQRNPQVYAAAMGAVAGLPAVDGEMGGRQVKGWATGLSAAEYRRALDIVSRADPNARVLDRNGNTMSMQPPSAQGVSQQRAAPAAPAIGAVMQGHRFMGGDPSSPSSWQAVH
jgi:hypothetical protein